MKNSTAKKLKQVPEGYLIIGVNPHKKKHAVVVMTQDAIVQTKFKFSNSRDGFEEVLQRARVEMPKTSSRGGVQRLPFAARSKRASDPITLLPNIPSCIEREFHLTKNSL